MSSLKSPLLKMTRDRRRAASNKGVDLVKKRPVRQKGKRIAEVSAKSSVTRQKSGGKEVEVGASEGISSRLKRTPGFSRGIKRSNMVQQAEAAEPAAKKVRKAGPKGKISKPTKPENPKPAQTSLTEEELEGTKSVFTGDDFDAIDNDTAMSYEETRQLALDIERIPPEKLGNIVDLLIRREDAYKGRKVGLENMADFEIDFMQLKVTTLRELEAFVKLCLNRENRKSGQKPESPSHFNNEFQATVIQNARGRDKSKSAKDKAQKNGEERETRKKAQAKSPIKKESTNKDKAKVVRVPLRNGRSRKPSARRVQEGVAKGLNRGRNNFKVTRSSGRAQVLQTLTRPKPAKSKLVNSKPAGFIPATSKPARSGGKVRKGLRSSK